MDAVGDLGVEVAAGEGVVEGGVEGVPVADCGDGGDGGGQVVSVVGQDRVRTPTCGNRAGAV